MNRKIHRGPGRPPKIKKPSADSMLNDIRELGKAINTVKRITNLPGVKSILTSLCGEKRHAEQLLAKSYPRIAKRVSGTLATTTTQHKRINGEKGKPSPPASIPESIEERTTKGEKIARGWRYAGAIKKNYSNNPAVAKMSKSEIRAEYRRFKRGLKTRIPEIIFRNASP